MVNDSEKKETASSASTHRRFSWVRVGRVASMGAACILIAAYLVPVGDKHLASTCSPLVQRAGGGSPHFAQSGFDTSTITIPAEEIRSGGPAKDGIPALTKPSVVSASQANYLRPNDRVIGFASGETSRAYPLKILNYHEIVNDRVGGQAVAVTYCPLCDSALAFDRRSGDKSLEFGVSGLLYNSNVLMYDRTNQVESLWSQLKSQGVSGPGAERKLRTLPLEVTTWSEWRTRHPATTVLSPNTGYARQYDRSPYAHYFERPALMFPAVPSSDRLGNKTPVLGVWTDSASRAYPISAFVEDRHYVEDSLGGKDLIIAYTPEARSLRVIQADEGVSWGYAFWFAWYAFHPDTSVFE